MGKREIIDADDAPTEPDDWIGAAGIGPSDRHRVNPRDPVMFHIYRASNDSCLFAVVAEEDQTLLPPCPEGGEWRYFKRFPETGQSRIGFSEKEAKSDIRAQGYHLNRIDIETAVGLAPPKAS